MIVEPFWRGLLVGLILSIPLGPVAVLCLRRTLEQGPMAGAATGLGATVSDTFYSALSLYLAVAVMGFVDRFQAALYLIAAAVLLITAIVSQRRSLDITASEGGRRDLAGKARDGLLISLLNPANILGVSSTVVALSGGTSQSAIIWVLVGVACGSAMWWIGLAFAVDRVRGRIDNRAANGLNRAIAVILAAVAMVLVAKGLASAGVLSR